MSHTKQAIEDIQRLGWEINNKSLVKLVQQRKANESKKTKESNNVEVERKEQILSKLTMGEKNAIKKYWKDGYKMVVSNIVGSTCYTQKPIIEDKGVSEWIEIDKDKGCEIKYIGEVWCFNSLSKEVDFFKEDEFIPLGIYTHYQKVTNTKPQPPTK